MQKCRERVPHNKANEIATICTHDRNGNMTVMPGLKSKYDAWNRLVEVRNTSDSLLATHSYNGLNQRVKKTVGGVVTTSFFNATWQELESITSGVTTSYIWGQRYIDDLVLREKGAEKLYVLADPNWNVVALTNASGTVLERMKYDAFGKVTWMNASFTTLANSAYVWNRTFTGQVFDSETGLMLYRNRFYNVALGRFVQRDPIGYDAEDENLYRYVGNMSIAKTDPRGLLAAQTFPCCNGKKYHPAVSGCCNGKVLYSLATSCCEDDKVVAKVSIWICTRPLNNDGASWIYPFSYSPLDPSFKHSYVCCAGNNSGCYGMQGYQDEANTIPTKKGDPIPKELLTVGNCYETKTCPDRKKSCCNSPKTPWDYGVIRSNCNTWARYCRGY